MKIQKVKRALEAIGNEYKIRKTASGNFQAVSPSGEVLATAKTEPRAREGAQAEYNRRRQGAYKP